MTKFGESIKEWSKKLLTQVRRDHEVSVTSNLSIKCVVPLIHSILNVHKKTKHVLATSLEDLPTFHLRVDEAFTEFVNCDVGNFKMPEIFALFCDQILSGKEKIVEKNIEVFFIARDNLAITNLPSITSFFAPLKF